MSNAQGDLEHFLFNYETTNRTDFRPYELKEPVKTVFKQKPVTASNRLPPPVKNIHTFTEWKGKLVPFGLLHAQKDIVRTNPWSPQKPYSKLKDTDEEHGEVVRSRPRLIMTPAVSMDDIVDQRVRSILCDDMYTSTATRSFRKSDASTGVRAPLRNRPAPANPITLPKFQPPYVSPEWRMDSVKWDNRQMRTYCRPTTLFWIKRKSSNRSHCVGLSRMSHFRKLSSI